MNTLVSHNTQKRKLFLLTSGNPEYTKNIDPSITCIHYPLPSLKLSITSIIKFFPAIIFIGKLLKKHNIDLIHSNTVRSHMIASIAAKI
ncbi:MAG: hypothetical protein U9Q15_04780 [Patescibacteria group bacterium]|nr:hypothetical protein [Patescibacteria group bacterium]